MNRADRLRLSLLVSLGIPVACGGTVINSRDDADAGSGGSGVTTRGGASPRAGSSSKGGSLSRGGSPGKAGSTSLGGKNFAGMSGHAGQGMNPLTQCSSPTFNPLTGLVSCSEGYRHRARIVACGTFAEQGGAPAVGGDGPGESPQLPRANGSPGCGAEVGGAGPTAESPCDAFEYGYCDIFEFGGAGSPEQPGVCRSGCVADADCGSGFICVCEEPDSPTGGACRPSNCKADLDCDDGYTCASFNATCSLNGFACQKSDDECSVDADCLGGDVCEFSDFEGHRECTGCVAGRPFLVAAEVRFAPVAGRSDWSLDLAKPCVDHLTWQRRSALAEHWTKLGQMEHASIAAFARFSLQLLSLGAPADLVEATTRALADETAHAKLCFSIAGAYAGKAIGPGPLDVTRSLEATSLVDIVDLVIAEGCFGETSAVLEALDGADAATDPVIGAAYRQIAADEQRHAELAFRFVRWALERDRKSVGACIASALSVHRPAVAARMVVAPCLQALVA